MKPRSLALVFTPLGGTAAVVPAVLPSLAEMLAVPTAELLVAVPALFSGLLVGVLGAALVTPRIGEGRTIAIGALGQAGGLALLAAAPGPGWVVGGAAVAGVGFGLVEAAATAAVRVLTAAASEAIAVPTTVAPKSATAPANRPAGTGDGAPRLLTRLTAFLAVAATLTPVLVLVSSWAGSARAVPALVAVVHLVAAFALMRSGTSAGRPAMTAEAPAHTPTMARGGVVLLAAALFCYVGVETVLSGWSAATVELHLGASAAIAALGTSAFWLIMSAGRMLGTRLIDRFGAPFTTVLCSATIAASVAVAAMLAVNGKGGAALLFLGAAVLMSGPCYALLLGTAISRAPAGRSVRVSAALVAVGAAGGALIPLGAQASLTVVGPPASTVVAAAAATVMLVLALRSRRVTA